MSNIIPLVLFSFFITLIQQHGRLGITAIEKMTGANRSTIKKHLATLTTQGHLLRFGKAKATWYTLA
ncbi:MAG: DUF977 family protein [Chthoniobacterales bacterium]